MSQGEDDRLLIEEAQRDPARFGQLYEQNFFCVYAYIARRVGQRHQAEDRFMEQRSIREIAQELGRSEGAVKQLQLRAIENLRAQLEAAHV